MNRLAELAAVFLKLGTIGFGGPAAHAALLDREVVERRNWLTREQFLDLLGISNLIPGPNSTEMAIFIGYRRAGLAGLLVAGLAFILPAALVTYALAWAYRQYGALPAVQPLLRGTYPAILAIIAAALWALGRKAFSSWPLRLVGLATAVAAVLGCDAVATLAAGTLAGLLLLGLGRRPPTAAAAAWLPLLPGAGVAAAATSEPASLTAVFLVFLKVGAVLYGTGYVLFAYLEGDLVRQLGWLTETELKDAIVVGQFTPGPILSAATFVGYLAAGTPGAAVATLGVFLPSFLFVLLANPLVPRLRQSRWTGRFLDAVNASSIGLMAGVTLILARNSLVDLQSPLWIDGRGALLLLAALVAVLRFRVGSAWLVLAGALAGWLVY